MPTSSLIRLLTTLLMLTGSALSSSLAWANETPTDPNDQTTYREISQLEPNASTADTEQSAADQSTSRPSPPPEADMPYISYNQERGGTSSAWIVTRDALTGGVFGALLGTAGYFLSG